MSPKHSRAEHRKTTCAASASRKGQKDEPSPSIQASSTSSSSPVYFWRATEPLTGYLSQWHYCPFTDDRDTSIIYQTAEHYMMYQKALLFSAPPDLAAQILSAEHPRQVKELGRAVPNFDEETWRAHREAVVRRGNLLKFTRPAQGEATEGWWVAVPDAAAHDAAGAGVGVGDGDGEKGRVRNGEGGQEEERKKKSLREMLLKTGDRELVEASPFDRIWGIGFGHAKAAKVPRKKWGLNLLGKALMEVREMLRKEAEGKEKAEPDGEGNKTEWPVADGK